VEAIRRYDLVATQEIQNETGDAALELLRAINEGDGPDYEMLLSGSSGHQADDPSGQERYAYFYNKEVIRSLAGAQLYEDSSSAFSRTPFVGRFAAGDWDFTLVEVHTQPTAAVAEIGALHQVVAWARATYRDDDVIALGDFNGACGHATPADLDTLSLRKTGYMWIVPDDADTNTSAKVCAYDRIVVTSAAGKQYAGRWGVDHETRDVSDHYPVWAEFSIAAR
jgi:endonuclease/exonuclease/phosphatase family metal-dependent hydrolase